MMVLVSMAVWMAIGLGVGLLLHQLETSYFPNVYGPICYLTSP
jgi:hypothetical protein